MDVKIKGNKGEEKRANVVSEHQNLRPEDQTANDANGVGVFDPSEKDDSGLNFTPQSNRFTYMGVLYGFHIWKGENGIQYLIPHLYV